MFSLFLLVYSLHATYCQLDNNPNCHSSKNKDAEDDYCILALIRLYGGWELALLRINTALVPELIAESFVRHLDLVHDPVELAEVVELLLGYFLPLLPPNAGWVDSVEDLSILVSIGAEPIDFVIGSNF